MKKTIIALAVCGRRGVAPLGAASEKIDYDAINKIKQQGLNPQTSQVMEISSWLTDVHGPRLTGSPNIQKAGEWAVAKMKEWGLQNVALEPWGDRNGFDRGWANEKFYMAAVSPQAFPIPGTPTGWTPGTNGLVRGEVVARHRDDAGRPAEVRRQAEGQVDPHAGAARRRRRSGPRRPRARPPRSSRGWSSARTPRPSSASPTRTPAAAAARRGRAADQAPASIATTGSGAKASAGLLPPRRAATAST